MHLADQVYIGRLEVRSLMDIESQTKRWNNRRNESAHKGNMLGSMERSARNMQHPKRWARARGTRAHLLRFCILPSRDFDRRQHV